MSKFEQRRRTLSVLAALALGGMGQGVAGQGNPTSNADTLPSSPHSLALDAPAGPADFKEGSVQFIGTATVLIRYAGFTILTDPNFLHKGEVAHLGYGLTSERLTEPALTLQLLPAIDLVILSHLHEDHFDRRVQESLPRSIPIVTTHGAGVVLEGMGFKAVYALNVWESFVAKKGEATLRITSMPARHGSPVTSKLLPETMGSLLEFEAGAGDSREVPDVRYRTYISGDTLVYDEIRDIPKRYPDIDLALLHLGGTRLLNMVLVTMDAKQGAEMMKIVAPRHAVPIHYNDYDVFKSSIEGFEREIDAAGLRDKVTFLKHGERYAFRGRPHDSNTDAKTPEPSR